MESLERKDTNPVPEEPIKSEGMVPSPSTSDRSNSAGSPPPHCSICLGKLVNTSFTDSCLHQFCFTCLLQWSKIKTECPLCKQTFKSIIHNVRSEGDYDQYDVNLQSGPPTMEIGITFPAPWSVLNRHSISPIVTAPRGFMYRTTMAPQHRRFNPLLNAEAVALREQIPSHAPQLSREEISHRNNNIIEFRRQVYRRAIWAMDLADAFGRFRESSAEYYTQHPGETHRLIVWLNRELQVLLNNNRSHIAYVMNVIMDAVVHYDIRGPQFFNIVHNYFGARTEHFVHEFSVFARTNFDIIGYDRSVVYQPSRVLATNFATRTISPISSSSSDSDTDSDSDVRLVADDRDNRLGMNTLSVGPHMIDMPGPSTVGSAMRLLMPNILPTAQMPPVIYTISSTSSESENECEVVGYVKPRHERTPEIIELDSESEAILPDTSTSNANAQSEVPLPVVEEVVAGPSNEPLDLQISRRTRQFVDDTSKCCMYEYFSSSSENDTDESDSDYNPQSKSRRRKKKSSKSSPRKLRSRKHKKSAGATRKRDKSRRDRSCSEAESEAINMPSTSKGTKRYNSDHSESEKPAKKSKKSKKAKSSKKSKKTKSKSARYITHSSCSSSTSSESETEIPAKKKKEETDPQECSEEREESRYAESECSSRLRIDENSHSSVENDAGDGDDDESTKRKVKSVVAAAPVRDSHSSDSEHSVSTKTSRGRYRSHKKRKESKKRRRSRS